MSRLYRSATDVEVQRIYTFSPFVRYFAYRGPIVGMVELCAKNLQIMRNDFTDYARTFCQLCAPFSVLRTFASTTNKCFYA